MVHAHTNTLTHTHILSLSRSRSPAPSISLIGLTLLCFLSVPSSSKDTMLSSSADTRTLTHSHTHSHPHTNRLTLFSNTGADVDVDTVRSNILRLLIPSAPTPAVDAAVTNFTATLLPNATWADIDYADGSRSWWFAAEHVRRTLLMASAFVSPFSVHHNKSIVRAKSDQAFEWWLRMDPQNSNWWWMMIGGPRMVAKYLLLLPNPEFTSMAYNIFDRTPLYNCTGVVGSVCPCVNGHACHYMNYAEWTGCNRVWAASFHILRGAIEGNTSRISLAYTMAHSAIRVVGQQEEGGIQTDGSFHQHGPQNYMGWGYGTIFTTNVLVLETYASGTRWTMADSQWNIFARLVIDGQSMAVRGANYDFLTCGRLFTYFRKNDAFGVNDGHYHYFAAFSPFELAFPTFVAPFTTPIAVFFQPLLDYVNATRPRASEFTAFGARLRGSAADSYRHAHFYDSDYSAHHIPEMAVFVHMVSSRTLSTECGNDENKRGRMLADGVMTVYSDGSQYESVFPLLNWTLLPGTTEVQYADQDDESPAHECAHVRDGTMRNSFVGGLSTGATGVSVMDFSRNKPNFSIKSSSSMWTDAKTSANSACINSTGPSVGMHCDLNSANSLSNTNATSVAVCEHLCCSSQDCNCWTWTSFQRPPGNLECPAEGPCCYLKRSTAPLVPAVNCTGGQIKNRKDMSPCVFAAKAWFFSNATTSLGIARRGPSCEDYPMTTTIQQCNLLQSAVVVGGSGMQPTQLPANSTMSCHIGLICNWIWHKGILYILHSSEYLLNDATLTISNEMRNGTEYEITQGDNTTLYGEVFTAFINHGFDGNQTYGYTVTPCQSSDDIESTLLSLNKTLAVLSNNASTQALCSTAQSKTLQAVLWPSSDDGVYISAKSAGCWDVWAPQSSALELGFLLQLQATENQSISISGAVPAWDKVGSENVTVSLFIPEIQLKGLGCTASSSGTQVVVSLNNTGETTTIFCEIVAI